MCIDDTNADTCVDGFPFFTITSATGFDTNDADGVFSLGPIIRKSEYSEPSEPSEPSEDEPSEPEDPEDPNQPLRDDPVDPDEPVDPENPDDPEEDDSDPEFTYYSELNFVYNLWLQEKIPEPKVSFSLQFAQTQIPSTMTLGGSLFDDYVGDSLT